MNPFTRGFFKRRTGAPKSKVEDDPARRAGSIRPNRGRVLQQEVARAADGVVRVSNLADRWAGVEVVLLIARRAAAGALRLAAAAGVRFTAATATTAGAATATITVATSTVIVVAAWSTVLAAALTTLVTGTAVVAVARAASATEQAAATLAERTVA